MVKAAVMGPTERSRAHGTVALIFMGDTDKGQRSMATCQDISHICLCMLQKFENLVDVTKITSHIHSFLFYLEVIAPDARIEGNYLFNF